MTVYDETLMRAANVVNEDRILAARIGRNAARALHDITDDMRGAIPIFPTVIHTPSPKDDSDTYSWTISVGVEPGSVLPIGVTAVPFIVTVNELQAEGVFYIGVDVPAPARTVAFTQATTDDPGVLSITAGERPEWSYDQLPSSFTMASVDADALSTHAKALVRAGRLAEEELLVQWTPALRAYAKEANNKHLKASAASSRMDFDDVFQTAVEEFLRNGLRRYTAPDNLPLQDRRPRVPVNRWLYINVRKALRSAIAKDMGIPAEVYTLRGILRQAKADGKDVETVDAAYAVVAYENTRNRLVQQGLTAADAAKEASRLQAAGELACRYTRGQVEQAMAPAYIEDHLSKPVGGSDSLTLGDSLANLATMDTDSDAIEMNSLLEGLYKSRGLSPEEVAAFEARSGIRNGITHEWASTSEIVGSVREVVAGLRDRRVFTPEEVAAFETSTGVRFVAARQWAEGSKTHRSAEAEATISQARRLYASAIAKLQADETAEMGPQLGTEVGPKAKPVRDDAAYSRARARIMHPAMRNSAAA